MTVAYDGTNYKGWQAQNGGETIEGKLNEALAALLVPSKKDLKRLAKQGICPETYLKEWKAPVVIGASRTDSGVHARGNVAVFDTDSRIPAEKFVPAINQHLPDDIRIVKAEEVALDWHPRRQACVKTYEYRVYNAKIADPLRRLYSHYVYFDIDIEKMRQAALHLVGEHDFRSFCNPESQVLKRGGSAVRTIYAIDIEKDTDGMICMRVVGNGFLYHMIRILAGTLLRVGMGMTAPEEVAVILAKKDRQCAGPTAPACGLTLVGMQYEDADAEKGEAL